jgi:hypothetical protein
MKNESSRALREPIVDGLFYPADARGLREEMTKLDSACKDAPGHAFGIVAPHAAYEKCGSCIAEAFHAAAGRKILRTVIIGPVHRDETDEIILPESSGFITPLGELSVDTDRVSAILSCGTRIIKNDIPHLEEHCLEVLLPFVQYHFPESRIIPILLGKTTRAIVKTLTQALYVAFGEDPESTLFVVSTNFSGNMAKDAAKKEADAIIDLALRKEWERLLTGRIENKFQACGAGCLAALLNLPWAEGLTVRLLERSSADSDDEALTGVEYAAMAIGPEGVL